LIARSGVAPQVLLVSSGSPGEGKSTVSLHLAWALAHYGKKVMLLEADMRRPVFTKRLKLSTKGGLSTALSDRSSKIHPEVLAGQPNLAILPAGPVPPYPSELLGSAPLLSLFEEWRREFDFIVVDSPPVLPVADAQILIAQADATILVARIGTTTRIGLRRSYGLLLQHAKDPAQPAIGILLNGIISRSGAYYGYYGTYGYKSYYTREGGEDNG
jgi:capsular exopolysaccharide synthesis family protein